MLTAFHSIESNAVEAGSSSKRLRGTISASQTVTLTYPEIVSRLYNLAHLAEPPMKGEKSGSWTSSFGGVARYDATTGTYQNWGDGDDSGGFLRKERESGIVAEVKGPGVIWRVWSAYPR